MTFSEALENLKKGDLITRLGWNSKVLHLNMVADDRCCNGGWIGLHKDNVLICPWTASQSDLLNNDWEILE